MMLTQTIDVPESREVIFSVVLPKTVPCGRTKVTLTFPAQEKSPLEEYYDSLPEREPTVEEVIAEAKRKQADRFKDGHDAFQKYCGCLAHIFPEDGAVIQRRWHEEWDREWDEK